MHDQLAHLVDLSRIPNVTIQVVPYDAGGHSGLLGAFVIADRPSAAHIVFIEDVIGGRDRRARLRGRDGGALCHARYCPQGIALAG
jgi:hypothetical protein